MAYQKTEWKAGDLITAERLNNNEDQTEANAKAIEDLQDVPAPTNGNDGKSAYQIWLDAGNTGDEAAFLASLKGEAGAAGKDGAPGKDATGAAGVGIKSIDFQTDADGKVTGVTVTGTDGKPITATVTATPAQA